MLLITIAVWGGAMTHERRGLILPHLFLHNVINSRVHSADLQVWPI